jgi:putative transposase
MVVKTLSTRTHSCPKCGFESDRDQNAALNILKKGLSILGMEWQNSTFGQKGTASKEGTLGERCTAALEGQPDEVSALAEPGTRIPCL